MRVPQFTLLQSVILLAILALLCSLPIQCQRAENMEECRIAAQILADGAQELSIMGDDPAAWMDEFRPELRWLAARKLAASRRVERSGFYDSEEEERINAAEFAAHGLNLNQFWTLFNRTAAKHGFKKPKVGPGHWETGMDRWPASCWPTFLAIAILAWTLVPGRQRRRVREL
jgi:hypothetical protein